MPQGINPEQLLTELAKTEKDGCLDVEHNSVSWKIYLEKGKLTYVSCSLQTLVQFNYHLNRLDIDPTAVRAITHLISNLDLANNLSPDIFFDRAIANLYLQGHLNDEQISRLIENLTRENLEFFLWLRQGTYSWIDGEKVSSLVAKNTQNFSIDLNESIEFFQQRLKNWQDLGSSIFSPYQRPYFFINHQVLEKEVPGGTLSPAMLEKLAQVMRGLSLRHLAYILKQDELKLAQILIPYIKNQIIYLREPSSPLDRLPKIPSANKQVINDRNYLSTKKVEKVYKIACIDDSITILEEMKRFLGEERFQVTVIDNPIKASSMIFRLKPDLVLMDITMPEINGYKLCSLLRTSASLSQIPIIMVTGNRGVIDKARAKLAGATDYLTKPFTKERLLEFVDKYLAEELRS
jgi:two-component system, chemotaxis family, response regulator PixG